jgi:hypothetical protein
MSFAAGGDHGNVVAGKIPVTQLFSPVSAIFRMFQQARRKRVVDGR